MATNYLPTTDAGLISFAANFTSKINGDPSYYGLTDVQATACETLYNAFVAAWNLLQDPSTKTQPNTVTKNDAKAALIDGENGIRQLVNIIQATPSVTNTQRAELLITIRDTDPTPVAVPSAAPLLSIKSTIGRTVELRLRDSADPDRRAKPAGVIGANVLSYVGAEAPSDLDDWQIEGLFTRSLGKVNIPSSVPAGSQVWFTAYWLNTRGQSGSAAATVTTNVAGSMPAAA